MKHKKTARELIGEANQLDKQVKAMDDHGAKSFADDSMTDAQREVHRKARNKLNAQANLKRRQAEGRD